MYTIPATVYSVRSSVASPFVFLIHDRPVSSGQDVLTHYLADAERIFKEECDALLSTEHVFTEADAERLTTMLSLLLDARRTWQEEASATEVR